MTTKNLYLTLLGGCLFILSGMFTPASAQNTEGFIYGKVTTIDNNVYQGAIRWGKEEAYWFDMFNSSKPRNKNLKYLTSEERDDLSRNRERWSSKWTNVVIRSNWNWNNKHTHSFACNFGDIKEIEIVGSDRVELVLKNGEVFDLEGGSNDIEEDIKVYDRDLGEIELKWRRIEKVEFMDTPKNLEYVFGAPLYGTVETDNGDFTGFVQWDHDERVSTDKLDGDNRDGDMSIEFGNIKSIERDGRGSTVVLKSGRSFYLTGSNDVDNGNRGIIVNIPGEGRVDVEWRDFRKVTFKTDYKDAGPSYSSYNNAKELSGTVKTVSGKSISGNIIYDLDESLQLEILQGNDDDIEYLIPFADIKRITPKNYSYTRIELKSGKKVLLSDSQDVTEDNDGVLIFTGKGDPTYIAWEDVDEIVFN